MNIDTVTLSGEQLALIDSSFAGTLPEYRKRVTLNYTNGKAHDERWVGSSKRAYGATRPLDIVVDAQSRQCSAQALVDLYEILDQTSTKKSQVIPSRFDRSPTYGVAPLAFHYVMAITAVHELYHVHQGWRSGGGKAFRMEVLKDLAEGMARSKAEGDSDTSIQGGAYLRSEIEQAARDFSRSWMDRNIDSFRGGQFNFMFPMTVLEAIFQDKKEPFRMIRLQ
jgi:hypothetical protein